MTSLVWTTWVVTFCCSVVFRFPAAEAFFSHPLHGVHHIALLREEGIAEVGRPLDVVAQAFDDVGQPGEPLNGRIPIFLLDGGGEGLALQVGVPGQPLLQLDDFKRVRRGGKRLRQERIRIKGDRRH